MTTHKRPGHVQRQVWLPDDVDAKLLELCEANPITVGDDSRPGREKRTRAAYPGPMAAELIEKALKDSGDPIVKSSLFLVWSRRGPSLSLCAIDTTKENAAKHKTMIESLPGAEDVWIEPRESNHCYGHEDLVAGESYLRVQRQKAASQVGRWRQGDFD